MNSALKRKTFKNLFFSFSAQLTSVALSVFMALIVPKILGVKDFSYWQLFLFYINYVGFFHFGITDGMYLKNGGIDYKKIDKKQISSQFYCLLIIQLIMVVIISVFATIFINDFMRKIILFCTGIYMLIANLNWFLGYVFQATNRVKLYSISVMIDKIIFLIFIIIGFIFKIQNLFIYIIIYIFTTVCALTFSIVNSKEIIKTKPYSLFESFKISLASAKIGINLTLSSVSSLLILGIGRFLVDKVWGIEAFGKFSFAISLTNFFLLFITQVSIVLFPTLRQVTKEVAKELYNRFNKYLNNFLPLVYVLYIPMKIIISFWLPQYKISLSYLGFLLPICIFDGKTQMISNTYFKVFREEKKMLKINLLTVVISFILSLIGIFIIKSTYAVIIGMLVSIAFRSIYGEIYLTNRMNIKDYTELKKTLNLIFISIIFIIVNTICNDIIAFLIMIIIYIIYFITTKTYEDIREIIRKIKPINN